MYTIDFNNPIRVHFIGIGGISMSGLAEILIKEGFKVTGSDMKASEITNELSEMGALINIGQYASNINDNIDLLYIQQLSDRTTRNSRQQRTPVFRCSPEHSSLVRSWQITNIPSP